MLNQRQDDERARLKAAGFTDAEIDAELGAAKPTRPPVRVASESTAMQGPGKAPARAATDLKTAIGTARALAQGATFGFGDEIEAGARSLAGAPYKTTRDQIRGEQAAYAEAHPVAAIGAELAGGLLTGGAALKAAQGAGTAARVARVLAPKVEATAGAGARAWNAAKVGMATGALTGAGSAENADDVMSHAVIGAGIGGASGAALSGLTDAVRRARQLVSSAGQKADPGVVRRVVQGSGATPAVAGGQKVLQAMGRAGMSVDDLAAASAKAEAPAALAEIIPEDEGVKALRVARNIGRSRDRIDKGLAERAAEEPSRYAEAIARETGVPEGLDAATVAKQAMARVEPRVTMLYEKAYAQPDVSAKPILRTLERLNDLKRGRMALERAGELSSGFNALQSIDPANPVISVQNLHNLRQGMDYALDRAVEEGDAQMVRILSQERATIDRAFKKAGGKVAQRADRLWESAKAEGEAFALGERSQLAQTKGAMVRLKGEARDPDAFRRGAASKQLARVESVADGAAGQVRNPVQSSLGNQTARARSSLAYSDRTSFGRAREEAERIVQRLRTKQAVSGNSTTAANLAEMADTFQDDPLGAVKAAASLDLPGVLKNISGRTYRGLTRGDNAAQADEMGRLLGAGLPGQMSRDEAVRRLRDLIPMMANIYQRNAVIQGGLGGAAARGLPQ